MGTFPRLAVVEAACRLVADAHIGCVCEIVIRSAFDAVMLEDPFVVVARHASDRAAIVPYVICKSASFAFLPNKL